MITPTLPVVYEGSNITIKCQATGKPPPVLSWYRIEDMSTPLVNNAIDYIITSAETPIAGNETIVESELTILSTDNLDMGNYSCMAANKLTNEFEFKLVDVYCKFRNIYWLKLSGPSQYFNMRILAIFQKEPKKKVQNCLISDSKHFLSTKLSYDFESKLDTLHQTLFKSISRIPH